MRLWHIDLIKYLPDAQFRGQLRELVAILHDWRDRGKTNHVLINKVMEYPKNDFVRYFLHYETVYRTRYGKWLTKYTREFLDFDDGRKNDPIFKDWHNDEYLKVCMANLYEKHEFGVGRSQITDDEWKYLCYGYKAITGREYGI